MNIHIKCIKKRNIHLKNRFFAGQIISFIQKMGAVLKQNVEKGIFFKKLLHYYSY